jgi:uncharacterized membrane protein YjjB (DUF3815 family)
MSETSKKWLIVAAVILVCSLHATLFYLRWHHNTGASVQVLIGTFWAAVIFLCLSWRWLKESKVHVIVALVPGVAALLPGAETSITWTIWSVMSFVS